MTKWADYCISRKRMNSLGTHIDKVMVHVDNGDTIGSESEWARSQVVKEIENTHTFVTIRKVDGKWQRGEDVRIIIVNGVKYIRTDSNNTEADNLGNLPDF